MKRLLLLAAMLVALSGNAYAGRIICASTTSTENTGLFAYVLPMFEAQAGIEVHVVAVGTGAAIEMGKRGDADVVLVHARELEVKAVEEGFFTERHDLMYNDFVIIGPPGDPAGVKGTKQAADALKKVASGGHPFVSRGDKSGTHTKELSLWKAAGVEPSGKPWYLEVGQGMEKAQRIASEKRAYTLTDRGTWLAAGAGLEMAIALEGDPALFNQYGVMAVDPKKYAHVKYREAMAFINWLVSERGQRAIAAFKDKNGNRLFTPNANAISKNQE